MIVKDPKAEVTIDRNLVQHLIDSQFPEFSLLEIKFLDAGWDNENYRLGRKYIIRLPRRAIGANLLLNEINCLPKLPQDLPISIPIPLKVGQPDPKYPWHWSIIPWFEGTTADLGILKESAALQLVNFLKILHQKNPQNAPINQHRGIPLTQKASDTLRRMERLKTKTNLINERIETLWQVALVEAVPPENYLIHGDLHPRNIIINNQKIVAIIDWGDMTSGDVATDLAALWMLFDKMAVRRRALQQYEASDNLIKRAIGWAIFFGVILLDTGLNTNAQHAKIGASILKNL